MLRVDNIPLLLKPAFHVYGFSIGALWQTYFMAIRNTCSLKRRNADLHTGGGGDDDRHNGDIMIPAIECIWHKHVPAYLCTQLPPKNGTKHVWMNHPSWYMRPIHVVLHWNGVERLVLGSAGHGGQQALGELIDILKTQEYTTFMAVDGPAGPPEVMKRGALDMGVGTGLPVVGMQFEYDDAPWGSLRENFSWDRKHFPLPFSTIRITRSAPIYVTSENYEKSRELLLEALGPK